ncbi:MAG: hypothetical protein AAF438_07985 [Pseudomonadota bacterium]
MSTQTQHVFEEHVADYINGHLSGIALQEFEQALATDKVLQDMVRLEQAIQSSVRSHATQSDRLPDFGKLERKINGSYRRWLNWVVPTTALAALVLTVAMVFEPSNQIDAQFENQHYTLTDQPAQHETKAIRIIMSDEVSDNDIEQLFQTHDLKILKRYPPTKAFDVELGSDTKIFLLEQDTRVQTIRQIQ